MLFPKVGCAAVVRAADRLISGRPRYEFTVHAAFQAWSQGGSIRDVLGPFTLLDMAVAPALISGT